MAIPCLQGHFNEFLSRKSCNSFQIGVVFLYFGGLKFLVVQKLLLPVIANASLSAAPAPPAAWRALAGGGANSRLLHALQAGVVARLGFSNVWNTDNTPMPANGFFHGSIFTTFPANNLNGAAISAPFSFYSSLATGPAACFFLSTQLSSFKYTQPFST